MLDLIFSNFFLFLNMLLDITCLYYCFLFKFIFFVFEFIPFIFSDCKGLFLCLLHLYLNIHQLLEILGPPDMGLLSDNALKPRVSKQQHIIVYYFCIVFILLELVMFRKFCISWLFIGVSLYVQIFSIYSDALIKRT